MEKLLGIAIDHQKIDVDEIQSLNPEEVIEHKVRQAYSVARKPVFVDDFSFWFDDLDGLPGPFIKYFIQADGSLEKLCRLADSLPSRRVTARAYFGYFDGKYVRIIHGELNGEITDHPKGQASYAIGTDFVFAVDGYSGKTRAELSIEMYEEVYSKVRAVDQIVNFLLGEGYEKR